MSVHPAPPSPDRDYLPRRAPPKRPTSPTSFRSASSSATAYSSLFTSGLHNLSSPSSSSFGFSDPDREPTSTSGGAKQFLRNIKGRFGSSPGKPKEELYGRFGALASLQTTLGPSWTSSHDASRSPATSPSASLQSTSPSSLFNNRKLSPSPSNSSSLRTLATSQSAPSVIGSAGPPTDAEDWERMAALSSGSGKAARLLGLNSRAGNGGDVSDTARHPKSIDRPSGPSSTAESSRHLYEPKRLPPPPPTGTLPIPPSIREMRKHSAPPELEARAGRAASPLPPPGAPAHSSTSTSNPIYRWPSSRSSSRTPSIVQPSQRISTDGSTTLSILALAAYDESQQQPSPTPPASLPVVRQPPRPPAPPTRIPRSNTVVSGVSSASSGTRRKERGFALASLESRNRRILLPPRTSSQNAVVLATQTSFLDWSDDDDEDGEDEVAVDPFVSGKPPPSTSKEPPAPSAKVVEPKRPALRPPNLNLNGESLRGSTLSTVDSVMDPLVSDSFHPYATSVEMSPPLRGQRISLGSDVFSLLSPGPELEAFPMPPPVSGDEYEQNRRRRRSQNSSAESFMNF